MNQATSEGKVPYALGLDIGIASVGWCVLGEDRIIDLGVRIFEKAETAEKGESLNLKRREARLSRRRLRRRSWRLTKLVRLLQRENVPCRAILEKIQTASRHIDHRLGLFYAPPGIKPREQSPWHLRVEGLERLLSPNEWARVLYHICKHRGFHWISRAEKKAMDSDSNEEGGRVKEGLANVERRLAGYRSVAEMLLAEFPDAQRNKYHEYSKACARTLLAKELELLFKRQQELGNQYAHKRLETAICDPKSGLFWAQMPALSGKKLLEMLGKCTFEKSEDRAPKACFTAERHVWLTRLNNLRITVDGITRPLNAQEHAHVLPLPYQQSGKFTYKQLRSALIKVGLPKTFHFIGLRSQIAGSKAKDPEESMLVDLKAWQTLRQALEKVGLTAEWADISGVALNGDPMLLDRIAWVLSVYKEDNEVVTHLGELELPNKERVIDALLEVRFSGFHSLSLKALRKIVPFMELGDRYDEACVKASYHHSVIENAGKGSHKYLPSLYTGRDSTGRMVLSTELNSPRNPVVLRSLNQTRKVVNAIVRKYGAPQRVHIEMARDLAKPWDERRQIEREQKEFRTRNDQNRETFKEHFAIVGEPKGGDFEKWRLYREQNGKCAYSLEPLDISRLLEVGYVEVDHILPYSRSFDDSKNNKVLVLKHQNQNKGNRTPWEYLSGAENTLQWRNFVAFVESNKIYRQAKRNRLLKRDFGKTEAAEFKDRNLNDTRYACRFFKNYIERYLQLAESSEAKRCVAVSGQLTSLLRARWGLTKIRGDSDRHHALDAAVIAACSQSIVQRMSTYARRKELEHVRDGFIDMETGEVLDREMLRTIEHHFPKVWPHFREELVARLTIDDEESLRAALAGYKAYTSQTLIEVRPLFVSRAATRRNSGAAHKETIYARPSEKHIHENHADANDWIQRIRVEELNSQQLEQIVGSYDKRNAPMIAALREWITGRDEREKRAKAIDASIGKGKERRMLTEAESLEITALRSLPRKPLADGSPGPIIRTVKINIGQLSGISVRGGIAKNDSMVRIDIFTKGRKFFVVPIYIADMIKSQLPNRAIVAYKDEDQWDLIDDTFEFRFACYPNDLLKITCKNRLLFGYYAGCNRSNGAISLEEHDRKSSIGKAGLWEGIGLKTALTIEKFNVDMLGYIYPAPPERRRGLA